MHKMSFLLVANGLYRTTPQLLPQSGAKLIEPARTRGRSPGFVTTTNPAKHTHLCQEHGVPSSRWVLDQSVDSGPRPPSRRKCTAFSQEPRSRNGCVSMMCNPCSS